MSLTGPLIITAMTREEARVCALALRDFCRHDHLPRLLVIARKELAFLKEELNNTRGLEP